MTADGAGAAPGRRIVVFGATGFTGRLVAYALVRRGARPVLAARSRDKLVALAGDLGGNLPSAVADAAHEQTVHRLVGEGDVLVSTVGPFLRWGAPAVDAAVRTGATYLDSSGEPPFIRAVLEQHGPRAAAAGGALLPAFGYDYVPGNLAGALALRSAGSAATKVTVGYFLTSEGDGVPLSNGTRASAAGLVTSASYAFRGGQLVGERPAARLAQLPVRGRRRTGFSFGGSEHLGLPRAFGQLRDVEVLLALPGYRPRGVQLLCTAAAAVSAVPGGARGLRPLLHSVSRRSGHGPDADELARTSTLVVAVAADDRGRALARVELRGPDPYTLTGELLAWAAIEAAAYGLADDGGLTPVAAYGLDRLTAGCIEAGITVTG